MKLTRNFIAEQAKKKQADRWTLAIKDGRHEGTLKSVTVDEKNNRCRMLIKPNDEFMLYRPSIDLADFYTEPLCRVFEPFYVVCWYRLECAFMPAVFNGKCPAVCLLFLRLFCNKISC